ncbi:MAG: Fe-S cluster assembly protein SufD [Acidobacteria bacterium]|nr:Fe-S cluster assembly protein SufD [Acidobacteriota bacterium]
MALTSAVMETQFDESFKARLAAEGDAAIKALRERAFAAFTDKGFPSLKDEDWKYTNVSPIAKETWKTATAGIELEHEDAGIRAHELLERFKYDRNGLTALNLAMAEIAVIKIAKDTVVDEPIELNFAAAEGTAIFPHVVVIAESGSKATIVESYSSEARSFTNAAVQMLVEDNASLKHYRVQKDSPEAFNYGVTEVTLGKGSFDSTNINLGGAISRHDIELKFTAEGGEAWVDGLYMLDGEQHSDTHSTIDHAVPNCISHQTYKGVLNGRSRGVFNGKVFVRENASGTDAQQQNKNLLLSNDARVDTKPQLEIFNDDVKCSHGATVGQLEDEEMFYLLTRGLPETLARNLLTYGFAEEVINKIEIEAIKSDLDATVLNRLHAEI